MSETAEIIRFTAGDEVPEWLLTAEPVDADAQRFGPLTFIANCIVVVQPDQYLICPVGMPLRLVEATALFGIVAINGFRMKVSAQSKDVVVPQAWCDVELDHPGAPTQTIEQVRASGMSPVLKAPTPKPQKKRLLDRIIEALTALFG